jgi:hypothetical protein
MKMYVLLLLPIFILLVPQMTFSGNICPEGRTIEQVPLKKLKERRVELRLSDEIVVYLTERAIIPDEKLDYCKDKTVGLVNGTTPFGEGGNPYAIPFSYLAKLSLHVKGKIYLLETTNMYNAWGDRPLEYNGRKYMAAHCYDPDTCLLRGIFSETSGAYIAEWEIRNGKPIRRILSDAPDLVQFFMRGGVNPPVFE